MVALNIPNPTGDLAADIGSMQAWLQNVTMQIDVFLKAYVGVLPLPCTYMINSVRIAAQAADLELEAQKILLSMFSGKEQNNG